MENTENKIYFAKLRKVYNFTHNDLSLITQSKPVKGYFFIEEIKKGYYKSITDKGEKIIKDNAENIGEYLSYDRYLAKELFPNLFHNGNFNLKNLSKIEEQSDKFNCTNVVKKCLKLDKDFEEDENEIQ